MRGYHLIYMGVALMALALITQTKCSVDITVTQHSKQLEAQ